jgi:hypothetical protein
VATPLLPHPQTPAYCRSSLVRHGVTGRSVPRKSGVGGGGAAPWPDSPMGLAWRGDERRKHFLFVIQRSRFRSVVASRLFPLCRSVWERKGVTVRNCRTNPAQALTPSGSLHRGCQPVHSQPDLSTSASFPLEPGDRHREPRDTPSPVSNRFHAGRCTSGPTGLGNPTGPPLARRHLYDLL